MKTQQIIWTVVPNGVNEEGNARVSIVVSPNLGNPDGSAKKLIVGAFPDFLNWPKSLAELEFEINLSNNHGDIIETLRPSFPDNNIISPAHWKILFPTDLPVGDGGSGKSVAGRRILTYPTKFLSDRIIDSYVNLIGFVRLLKEGKRKLIRGSDVDEVNVSGYKASLQALRLDVERAWQGLHDDPILDVLFDANLPQSDPNSRSWRSHEMDLEQVVEEYESMLEQYNSPILSSEKVGLALNLFDLFHHPSHRVQLASGGDNPSNSTFSDVEVTNSTLSEFHTVVSALDRHPSLIRKIGLVVDAVLPISAEKLDDILPQGRLQLNLTRSTPAFLGGVTRKDYFPSTYFEVQKISGANNIPYTFVARSRDPANHKKGFHSSNGFLPLGTDRVAVEQLNVDGAITKIQQAINRLQRNKKSSVVDLVANPEKLLPGAMEGIGISIIFDELSKAIAAQFEREVEIIGQIGGGFGVELFAEDLLQGFRFDCWDGKQWLSLHKRQSLYTFKRTSREPPLEFTVESEEGFAEIGVSESGEGDSNVSRASEALFRWDGWSLSSQREISEIDKDGNVVPPSTIEPFLNVTPKFVARTKSLPKLRFLTKYKFRARTVDIAGNSWSIAEANDLMDAMAEQKLVSQSIVYRRVEPIRSPFIYPMQKPGAGETTGIMAIRGSGVKSVQPRKWCVMPPDSSYPMWVARGRFDKVQPDDSYAFLEAHNETLPEAFDEDQIKELKHPFKNRLRVPYLPDPSATKAALYYLPGEPVEKFIELDFRLARSPRGSDSAASSFIIELTGEDKLETKIRGRKVSISLPAGTRRYFQISSLLEMYDKKEVDHADSSEGFFLYQMVKQGIFDKESIHAAIHNKPGINPKHMPLVTPDTEILLVHAIKQPRTIPTELTFRRATGEKETTNLRDQAFSLGKTEVQFAVDLKCHVPSTATIDIEGSWVEIDDHPDHHRTESQVTNQLAFSMDVEEKLVALRGLEPIPRRIQVIGGHKFNDTKHRFVRYSANAISRFTEFYPKEFAEAPEEFSVRSDETPKAHIHIFSTNRPKPSEILNILPAFLWETRSNSGTRFERVRHGGGMEIEVKRPWFSQGEGELLGILVAGTAVGRIDPAYSSAYSDIGIDPILASEPVVDRLTLRHLISPKKTDSGLELPFVEPAPSLKSLQPNSKLIPVDVAGYEVGYDPATGKASCFIQIDVGDSYYPFIRLAVARYQPYSVPGVELSKSVQTEFNQLPPKRTFIVEKNENGDVSVIVEGACFEKSKAAEGPTKVRMELVSIDQNGCEINANNQNGYEMADNHIDNSRDQEFKMKRLSATRWRWFGGVRIAKPKPDLRYTVIVREYETFLTDKKTTISGGNNFEALDQLEERLVYMDSFELPSEWI